MKFRAFKPNCYSRRKNQIQIGMTYSARLETMSGKLRNSRGGPKRKREVSITIVTLRPKMKKLGNLRSMLRHSIHKRVGF
jgi:hypothetical protein